MSVVHHRQLSMAPFKKNWQFPPTQPKTRVIQARSLKPRVVRVAEHFAKNFISCNAIEIGALVLEHFEFKLLDCELEVFFFAFSARKRNKKVQKLCQSAIAAAADHELFFVGSFAFKNWTFCGDLFASRKLVTWRRCQAPMFRDTCTERIDEMLCKRSSRLFNWLSDEADWCKCFPQTSTSEFFAQSLEKFERAASEHWFGFWFPSTQK